MRRNQFTLLPLPLLMVMVIFLFSCTKEEERLIHDDYTHTGIKPPPYSGVSKVLVENYVSKIYIDLIGQKPTETEKIKAVDYLIANELSTEAREKIIGDVVATEGYKDRLFQISTDLLLNGMSEDEVAQVHLEYTFVRDLLLQQGDTFTAQFFENELNKLQKVLDAPDKFNNGEITLSEYFSALAYNLIYDEINMGSENFVKSCFENFFKRQPTVAELTSGVNMVDGAPSSLLLREGKTKTEFLLIMTEDAEFFQGRVLDNYGSLLLRKPNSVELAAATDKFLNTGSLKQMQIDIVKTDEYAGFD